MSRSKGDKKHQGSKAEDSSRQVATSMAHRRLLKMERDEVRARHRNPEIDPRARGEGVKRGGYTR